MIDEFPSRDFMDGFLFILGTGVSLFVFFEVLAWIDRKNRMVILFVLGFSLSAKATVFYVNQAGIPPNTNSLAWLNAWSGISGDDVIHLSGNFTNVFNPPNRSGGTTGHPVVIAGDGATFFRGAWGSTNDPAQITDAVWYGTGFHDLIISNLALGCAQWNGTKYTNSNGNGLQFTNNLKGFWFYDCTNVEVSGVQMTNLAYIRLSTNAVLNPAWPGFGGGHWLYQYPGPGCESLRFEGQLSGNSAHNCKILGAANGMIWAFSVGYSYNNQVYSNEMSECSWGLGSTPSADGTYSSNFLFWANSVHDLTNFAIFPNNDPGSSQNHSDGIIIGADMQNGMLSHYGIYRNTFGPRFGYGTAWVYTEAIHSSTNWNGITSSGQNKIAIYANKFYDDTNDVVLSNGHIGASVSGLMILNNSFFGKYYFNVTYNQWVAYGSGLILSANQTTNQAILLNNYYDGINQPVTACQNVGANPSSVALIGQYDYNGYYCTNQNGNSERKNNFATTLVGNQSYPNNTNCVSGPWSDWQTFNVGVNDKFNAYGSITPYPVLNPDGSPDVTSFLTGAGTNVYSLLANAGFPAVDFYGNTLASSGALNIGAFQSSNPSLPSYALTMQPDGSVSYRTNTEVVTLTCTNQYVFNGWTKTAGTIAVAGSCITTFTMPNQAATVTANYTNLPTPPAITNFINVLNVGTLNIKGK